MPLRFFSRETVEMFPPARVKAIFERAEIRGKSP